jgi:predicted GNAT family acetyltransferase
MSATGDISVTDNRGQSRFEITVDGEFAGSASYTRGKGLVSFMHTEIDDAFGGQGLGGKLVSSALGQVREEGLLVLPFCPFVRKYISKHEGYIDLVPEDRRAEFELTGD